MTKTTSRILAIIGQLLKHSAFSPIAVTLFYLILTYWASGFPFFWDNVLLASKYAHHFFEHGLQTWIVPISIDAGHPPLYGLYLAGCWKVLGKTLAVSHWAIFPFTMGIVWFYWGIAKHLLSPSILPLAMLLLVIEPCVLTQTVLASTDIALLCMSMGAVYSLISGRYRWLYVLLPIMAMLSLRGIILSIAVGICHLVVFSEKGSIGGKVKLTLPYYLPFILITAIWVFYHYQQTGFLTDNYNNDNWSEQYGSVSLGKFILNIAVVVWRFMDQGRLFVWISVAGILFFAFLKHQQLNKAQKQLIGILSFLFLFLLPFVVLRNTPILHRYFMLFYLLSGVLFLSRLPFLRSHFLQTSLVSIAILSLLSGHFWIYPYPIANGWDATLAVVPYFEAKEQVNLFLEKEVIHPAEVTGAFPMVAGTKFTHLTDENKFQLTGKGKQPIEQSEYVLFSNISNDFTPLEIEMLSKDFELVKSFDSRLIKMQLLKRKKEDRAK